MNENIESDELKEKDIVKISHMINIPNYSLLNICSGTKKGKLIL